MFSFTRAIVKTPGRSMISGLTGAGLGLPDYDRALLQHQRYIAALEACGLEVTLLEADERFPDSTFIEDAAVLTPHCAVVTRPAAPSRTGETDSIRRVLPDFFRNIEIIEPPGTLDGGDVMQVGNHFYIGLSRRTNREGARQLIAILERYGLSGSTVAVSGFLHLKTGITCIAGNTLLAAEEFIHHPAFSGFTFVPVAPDQAGAANGIRINDRILVPAGYPAVRERLTGLAEAVIELDISEFAKLDGGLTCLSLRF